MNPTLSPVRPAVTASPDAVAVHLDRLMREPDTRIRNEYALGWIKSVIEYLAHEVTTDMGRSEIADALAMLTALDQATRAAGARWTYDRAAVDGGENDLLDPADPSGLPAGVVGYSVGPNGWCAR